MINRALIFLIFSVVLVDFSWGHPGGLDSNGGHVDRATGEYHCHKTDCITPVISDPSSNHLDIVSFNIQFLGNPKNRDEDALAALMAPADIVVVQELLAPPFAGTFPDGTPFKPDPESARFFEAMTSRGFDFVLSEEDTGTGNRLHVNGSSTEWWVTFYKPDVVEPAMGLPQGFLATDHSNNNDYERVPYATAFQTVNGGNDFVLVSVHLKPGDSSSDKSRRQHELATVASWIDANDATEKDFFVLGDMNFKNCAEISAILPSGFQALNSGNDCQMTNTHVTKRRPYDNVILSATAAGELANSGQFEVINLIEAMRLAWFEDFTQPYPGDAPYNHDAFRARYSDHHPVRFRIRVGDDDD